MPHRIAFETIIDFPLGVGESPVWDHRSDRLWFVDIAEPAIFRCAADGSDLARFPAPATVGSLGLAGDGRLVVGLRGGVQLFHPESGTWTPIADLEIDRPENRLNDGVVGPDGAFWIGTMFEHMPYQPTASLYRVSLAGEVRRIRTDIHVSNGLAWSPDGRRLYHVDSVVPEILAYDFDPATGAATNPASFARFDAVIGHPDGAAVDAAGCYWSAGVTAGRLNRFAPEGALIETYDLPVAWPTMPCFGGSDMKTLFVTSMTHEQSAGSLIAGHADVAGQPAHIFGEAPTIR